MDLGSGFLCVSCMEGWGSQQPGNQRLGVLRACVPRPTIPRRKVEVSTYHHPQSTQLSLRLDPGEHKHGPPSPQRAWSLLHLHLSDQGLRLTEVCWACNLAPYTVSLWLFIKKSDQLSWLQPCTPWVLGHLSYPPVS